MKPRWEAGRALDRTPTRSSGTHFYVIGLLGAAALAAGFAPPRPQLATLMIACLVAVVAASPAPAALEQRITPVNRVPGARPKPFAGRDLDLTGESPTSRSEVKILTGAFTSAPGHRGAFGPMRAHWVVTLGRWSSS